MLHSILKSILIFSKSKDMSKKVHLDQMVTIQDAYEKLRYLYTFHDLKRCEEISDLLKTLKGLHSKNPLTPINTLPSSKKYLFKKYL